MREKEEETCETCKFFMQYRIRINPLLGDGICRKNPPKLGKDGIGIFPEVGLYDYCGAYQRKITRVN